MFVFCFFNILRTYFPKRNILETDDMTTGQYYMGRILLVWVLERQLPTWGYMWKKFVGGNTCEKKIGRSLKRLWEPSNWCKSDPKQRERGKEGTKEGYVAANLRKVQQDFGSPGAQVPHQRSVLPPRNGSVWVTLPCACLRAVHSKYGLRTNRVIDLRAQ